MLPAKKWNSAGCIAIHVLVGLLADIGYAIVFLVVGLFSREEYAGKTIECMAVLPLAITLSLPWAIINQARGRFQEAAIISTIATGLAILTILVLFIFL
jgi:O-antigen/teichoic acid export membrane protein